MDIGFLRAFQPQLMNTMGLLAFLILGYAFLRYAIHKADVNADEKRFARLWVNRIAGGFVVLVIIITAYNALQVGLTDRVPRADADKAKSGVYQQMQNLQHDRP